MGKFSTEDGKGASTLQEQIMKLKEDISKAAVTIRTGDMKMKHNKKELSKLTQQMKSTEAAAKKVSKCLALHSVWHFKFSFSARIPPT